MRTNTGQQEPDTEQSKYAALIAQASILAAMLFTLLFTAFGSVQAQDNKKIPRVGFLSATSPTANSARIEAFRQGLRDLGYAERKNIIVEWRCADGKFDRPPQPCGRTGWSQGGRDRFQRSGTHTFF
jgi:hypothetical protein